MHTHRIEDDINAVLAHLDSTSDPQGFLPGPGIPDKEPEEETLHIYPVADTKGNITGYYFSNQDIEDEDPEVEMVVTASVPQPPYATQVYTSTTADPAPKALAVITVLLFFLLIVGNLSFSAYLYFFSVTTITLTPRQVNYNPTVSIHLVTGVPTSATQLQAREIKPLTITQHTSVQASGSFHQDPTYAIGYVTFYNGQFSPVTVAAGTQLLTQAGQAILTTQTVTVPGVDQAANPPALGQATIQARAIQAGAAGNIQAYAINGQCCATSMLVKNTQAFTGGQNEKNYTIVRQQDIDGQITPLKAAVAQSMTTTLESQAAPGETLVPAPCTPMITANHHAGDIAQSVTTTVSETCSGLLYQRQALYQVLQTYVQSHNPGSAYMPITVPTMQVLATEATPPTVQVLVHCVFVYHFSDAELTSLKATIAGKRTRQAQTLLQQFPGVAAVTIQSGTQLPSDTNRIIFQVVYLAG